MTTILQDIKNIDEEKVKKLEYAFSIGADKKSAYAYANISKQTYYNWIESFPELAERFDFLQENTPMLAYKVVRDKLEGGDIKTARWYLERKKRAEFGKDSTVDDLIKNGVSGFKFIRNDNTDNQADNQTTDSVG